MKKRRAETLVEFLVATAIFGTMMIGVCNFIANQTQTLVNIRHRDEFMYYANWLVNQTISGEFGGDNGTVNIKNRNILHHINHNVHAGEPTTYPYHDFEATKAPTKTLAYLQDVVSFDWNFYTRTLTVKKGERSMSFNIAPSD